MVDRTKLAVGVAGLLGIRSPKMHGPSTSIAIPDNFIGVEMEVESAPRDLYQEMVQETLEDWRMTPPAGWARVEDGSLRNRGAEFITESAVMGDDLIQRLRTFEQWALFYGVQSSFRTSTHIHVDFSQKRDTMYVIQDFLMGYYLLEELFYYMDSTRVHSGYCYPFSTADSDLFAILRATDSFSLTSALRNCHRYYGCNPASLARHGTIEFRQPPLNTSADAIINYINLILRLKKYVLTYSEPKLNVLEVINQHGVDRFIDEVAGPLKDTLKDFINKKVINRRYKVLSTIYNSRRVGNPLGLLPWSEVIKKAKRNPLYAKFLGTTEQTGKFHEPKRGELRELRATFDELFPGTPILTPRQSEYESPAQEVVGRIRRVNAALQAGAGTALPSTVWHGYDSPNTTIPVVEVADDPGFDLPNPVHFNDEEEEF